MVSVSTEFKARSQVIYIHQHHGRLGKKITQNLDRRTDFKSGKEKHQWI